jgi:hypothetical protein
VGLRNRSERDHEMRFFQYSFRLQLLFKSFYCFSILPGRERSPGRSRAEHLVRPFRSKQHHRCWLHWNQLPVARGLGATRVVGIEGSWPPEGLHDNRSLEIMKTELEQRIAVPEAFDLCISLEVAEHLKPDRRQVLSTSTVRADSAARMTDASGKHDPCDIDRIDLSAPVVRRIEADRPAIAAPAGVQVTTQVLDQSRVRVEPADDMDL